MKRREEGSSRVASIEVFDFCLCVVRLPPPLSLSLCASLMMMALRIWTGCIGKQQQTNNNYKQLQRLNSETTAQGAIVWPQKNFELWWQSSEQCTIIN